MVFDALVAAVRALEGDGGAALLQWHEQREAQAVRIARRWYGDEDSAATAVADLVEEVWKHVRAGREMRNPEAWCRTLLRRSAADRFRLASARQEHECHCAPLLECESPLELLVRQEEVALAQIQLARLISRLPPPYREILSLQKLQHGTRTRTMAFLHRWSGVRHEGARTLIRRAHGMLAAALDGGDPRHLWPERYSSKNPYTLTPPPLEETTH